MAGQRAYIGTSGWSYPAWRAGFYQGVPQRRWLAHCAVHFTAVEVNATFYRTMKPEIPARWRDDTPAGFGFAVKGHRGATHLRRLRDAGESVQATRDGIAPLGDRIAAVLWQLPPNLKAESGLLGDFANVLAAWPEVRHVLEFRHESWFTDATARLMADHGLVNCLSDSPRWPLWDAVTAEVVYVRLHGHETLYVSAYGEVGLRPWADRVAAWLAEGRDVHVYFDNDAEGAAPYDALTLMDMIGLRAA